MFSDKMSPWDYAMVQKVCRQVDMPAPELTYYRRRKKRGKKLKSGRRRIIRRRRYGRAPDHSFSAMKMPYKKTLDELRWSSSRSTRSRIRPRFEQDDNNQRDMIRLDPDNWEKEILFSIGEIYTTGVAFHISGRAILIEYDPMDRLSFLPGLMINAIMHGKEDQIWVIITDLVKLYFSEKLLKETPDPLLGLDDTFSEIHNILQMKTDLTDLKRLGLARRHILLVGPPGCGKTLLIKTLCQKFNKDVAVIYVRGYDDFEKWVPIMSAIAKYVNLPVLIIADEIDEMARTREDSNGRTFEFLRLMDGVISMSNVTFIASTNRPDLLDPALLRPERFSPVYVISWPDAEARRTMFEIFLKRYNKRINNKIIDKLVGLTEHWSGADLRAVVEDEVYRIKGELDKFDINLMITSIEKKKGEIERVYNYWSLMLNRWKKEAQTTVYHG